MLVLVRNFKASPSQPLGTRLAVRARGTGQYSTRTSEIDHETASDIAAHVVPVQLARTEKS